MEPNQDSNSDTCVEQGELSMTREGAPLDLPGISAPPPTFDGRMFVWVLVQQAWALVNPTPQLIVDVEMFKYKQSVLSNQGVVTVLREHVLTLDEYGMTLEELKERYPLDAQAGA
jgi:hypothetical protein